jgi:hypothetical protein
MVLIAGLVLVATPRGDAAGWAQIVPGESKRRDVEAAYGKPSRDRTVVEEGRTVGEWTYLSDKCPKGVNRMVIAWGLIVDGQFVADVVRALTVYPDAGAFSESALRNGWGEPVRRGIDDTTGRTLLGFSEGLIVALDRTGSYAEVMLFAPVAKR